MNLVQLLAIPPLSKVQVSSRREIQEASLLCGLSTGRGQPNPPLPELPFWYFQCENAGLLELRSPGGYVTRVRPDDVCDVILADPLLVQAMPHAVFLQRSRLSAAERHSTYGPHLFQQANVMWVEKDRWGRVDRVGVRFVDDAFNHAKGTFACTLSDESRRLVGDVARRTRMPVSKYGDRPNFSAQNGELKETASARRRLGAYLSSRLRGAGATRLPCDA